MQDINTRGTFMLSRACIPHLEQSDNAHILTLSPPLDLNPQWAGNQPPHATNPRNAHALSNPLGARDLPGPRGGKSTRPVLRRRRGRGR